MPMLAKWCHTARFGCIPKLAIAAMGGTLSESFCERVVSAGNHIMTDGAYSLSRFVMIANVCLTHPCACLARSNIAE